MRFAKNKLGLESEENELATVTDPDVIDPNAAAPQPVEITDMATPEVANAVVDVIDENIENDQENVSGEISDVMSAVDELHTYANIVGDAEDEDGMTPREAEIIGTALESVYERLGIECPILSVSLEEFKTNSKRSTTLAMESIGEQVKKVWDALVKMIDRLIRWVIDFFGDVFQNMNSLTKRAQKVLEQAKNMGDKPSKTDIEDEALKSRLFSPEMNPKNIASEYVDFMESQYAAMTQMYESANYTFDVIYARFKNDKGNINGTDKQSKEDVVTSIKQNLSKLFNNSVVNNKYIDTKTTKDVKVYTTKLYLSGFGWYAIVPQTFEEIQKLKLGTFKTDVEKSFEFIPVLTQSEIKNVCAAVMTVSKLEGESKKIRKLLNTLRTFSNTIAESMSKESSYSFDRQGIAVRQKLIKAVLTLLTADGFQSVSRQIRVTRDMLRVCELSVAAHPGK